MKLFRVLIGSLDCLCPFWLARVITLVVVLRHSLENRSRTVVTIIASSQTTHQIRHSPYTSRRTCFGMSKTGKPTFLKHSVYLYNSLRKKFKIKQVTTKHWSTRYLDLDRNYLEITDATTNSKKLSAIWSKVKLTKYSVSICMRIFSDLSRALTQLKVSVRHKWLKKVLSASLSKFTCSSL